MMTKIAILLLCLLSPALLKSQMKQTSHVVFSNVCGGQMSAWDHEKAIVNYNTSNNTLEVKSDIYEMTYELLQSGERQYNEDNDGMPITINAKFSIPDLEFKTSADNGETHTFNTEIKCNGIEKKIAITYIFIYAPRVAESNLNGAPLCSFRLDFAINIDPKDFNLNMPKGCDEIVMKVQDALLNKIE